LVALSGTVGSAFAIRLSNDFISLCYVIFNDELEIKFLSENAGKT